MIHKFKKFSWHRLSKFVLCKSSLSPSCLN